MTRSEVILQSSRRDARFTAALWIGCCLWTVGYCALFAYRGEAPPALVLGIPDWVVWGILAPWAVATLLTCWYALRGMRDEDLGEDHELPGGEAHGERHG